MKRYTIINKQKYFSITIGALLLSTLLLVPPASSLTYQDTVNVSFTFNPTLSISLSDPSLTIDNLTPSSSSDSNIVTVSVSTNAGYGYYMSATAGTKTTNTNLTNTDNSNFTFTSLSSNVSSLSNIPDNNWGYSYSTDDGTTWISGDADNASTGYNGLPLDNDDSGATGIKLISTDTFSNSGSIKFKIGAKAAATQAAGTYTNTVNFYAVANPEPTPTPVACEAGKICYNINALTGAEGTMGKQELDDSSNAITDNSTVTLLASNFSRTGYGFAGWSDAYDYTGNLYGPQETITAPTGTTANGLSLYAIWVKSEGSLQDSIKVAQVCNRLTAASSTTKTLNSVSALTDQRDGDTYAIAKLADGKCWMIENLRLDNSATLTIANTNNPLNDGTNVTIKHSYADTNTYNTLSVSQDPTTNTWCNSSAASCDDQSMVFTGNTTNRASYEIGAAMTNDANIYSYGNYYNWYSATAGRGTYNFNTNNNSVTGDLCPAGWHLPTGGMAYASGSTSGINVTGNTSTFREFYKLSYKIMDETKTAYEDTPNSGYSSYSTNTTNAVGKTAQQAFRSFPNNYLYSGFVGGDVWNNRGVYGLYWSSTTNSAGYAYRLLNSSLLVPSTGFNYKFNGGMVRCVASGV